MFGVFFCVLAELWQPQWLRNFCADSSYWLFPGQFAPMQQKTYGAILVLIGIIDLEAARRWLSTPWLVARSRLSFPLYLVHWPVLFGPAAALFLLLNGVVGIELARVSAIVAGIALSFICSGVFRDRGSLRGRVIKAVAKALSGPRDQARRAPAQPCRGGRMNGTRLALIGIGGRLCMGGVAKAPVVIDSHGRPGNSSSVRRWRGSMTRSSSSATASSRHRPCRGRYADIPSSTPGSVAHPPQAIFLLFCRSRSKAGRPR